jgi:hypothetical protein
MATVEQVLAHGKFVGGWSEPVESLEADAAVISQ